MHDSKKKKERKEHNTSVDVLYKRPSRQRVIGAGFVTDLLLSTTKGHRVACCTASSERELGLNKKKTISNRERKLIEQRFA